MQHIIDGVMPIGTPWGGPESRRYLSALVSLLLHLERRQGTARELQAAHERLYHLYLAVSGIGASTVWLEGLPPGAHEQMVDRLCGDYVGRTMAYAGCRYQLLAGAVLGAERGAAQQRIRASIDRGVPVLVCSAAAEWSLVTGYEDGGARLIGWDGAQTYWGPPAIAPEAYLENGLFIAPIGPDTVARCVIVEGRTLPQASSREVLAHVAAVLAEQRSSRYDREFKRLLQDEEYCRLADETSLRRLWTYFDGFFGWYAENRCFLGTALHEEFPPLPDIAGNAPAIERLHHAGGYLIHTHDLCWEGWRTLRTTHACQLPEDEPCHHCGGCLRPATAADYTAFREPARRQQIAGYLKIIDWNDARVAAELKRCVALL